MAGVALIAGFVLWELRNRYPMVDPRLFRHRGMATGSAAIFLMFLAMFGFFFIGVQYLQLLHGYSALKAGLALLPMSVVFVVISPVAASLSERLGQRVVSAAGLFIAAAGFALFLTVTPASGFALFLVTSLVLGLGIALAMTPATNAIVASLPPAKQGIASAINDLSRELGSAFGVAIIGSAFNTGYRSSIDQHLASLPSAVAERAHEAPATAYEAAARLGAGGQALLAHTNTAFVSGLHAALLISGVAMLLGGLYVALRAPSRSEEVAEDVLDEGSRPAGRRPREHAVMRRWPRAASTRSTGERWWAPRPPPDPAQPSSFDGEAPAVVADPAAAGTADQGGEQQAVAVGQVGQQAAAAGDGHDGIEVRRLGRIGQLEDVEDEVAGDHGHLVLGVDLHRQVAGGMARGVHQLDVGAERGGVRRPRRAARRRPAARRRCRRWGTRRPARRPTPPAGRGSGRWGTWAPSPRWRWVACSNPRRRSGC